MRGSADWSGMIGSWNMPLLKKRTGQRKFDVNWLTTRHQTRSVDINP